VAYLGAQPNKTLTKTTSQSFNGTGSATVFTLNRAVNTEEELEVFVENVQQEPGSGKSYTASGTTLTFDEAPPSGTGNIYVIYRGLAEVTTRLEHDANAALSATTGTFTGDLTVDTSTLKVDSTNNRVGIGTSSPAYTIDAASSGNTQIHLKASGQADGLEIGQLSADGGSAIIATNNNYLKFGTNNTERMRIDSSGKVGVGETSPLGTVHIRTSDASITSVNANADDLVLENNGNCGMSICSSTSGEGNINFIDSGDTNIGRIQYTHSNNNMIFRTNDIVAATIDSSGNLLVGQSSDTFPGVGNTVQGISLHNSGRIAASSDGNTAAYFNRKTSDGTIVDFRKDGTAVGGIGAVLGDIFINTGNTGLRFYDVTSQVIPVTSAGANRDNAIDLGNSGVRFDDIFATNGTIQTSDQNEKNTITDSDLGLDFINRLSPKSYIFNGKTRTHYGLIAQDVETVLGDISKPTSGFAGFIKSDISEEQDGSEYRYGLRYTEFVGPLIKALQEADAKIEALEAKVAALEGN